MVLCVSASIGVHVAARNPRLSEENWTKRNKVEKTLARKTYSE